MEEEITEPPPVYEPPAILWEHEFTALAECSPACPPGSLCFGDICLPPGG